MCPRPHHPGPRQQHQRDVAHDVGTLDLGNEFMSSWRLVKAGNIVTWRVLKVAEHWCMSFSGDQGSQ